MSVLKVISFIVWLSMLTPCMTQTTTVQSWFDPQVEFLEVGVAVNGVKSWKGLGLDVCGTYGGCMGIGGLESVVPETGAATGIITDYFGNNVASVQSGAVIWNTTKVGGYGALPNNTARPLSATIGLSAASGWRGKVIDSTGFYYWGARPYDPQSGRFLSPDPAGHSSSMTLYDYVGNDPINRLDADGRVASGFGGAVRDTAVGFGNLTYNLGGSLGYRATSAFNQNYANDIYETQWQGLQNTGTGFAQLGRDLISGDSQRYSNLAAQLSGGEGVSGAYRTGYVGANIGMLFAGGVGTSGRTSSLANLSDDVARVGASAARGVNDVPSRLSRVVDLDYLNGSRLGASRASEVFVAASNDLAGITTSRGLAERLSLLDEAGNLRQGPFGVIDFNTPATGLASPVFRTNPGFLQGGFTQGGAREFSLPNLAIDDLQNVNRRSFP